MPGGVDPNRNYAYEFGNPTGASSNPNSQVYHGPEPFSENCTARLRDFVLERNFISAVSLHSGTEVIIGPWAWSSRPPSGIDGHIYNKLGKALEDQTGLPFNYLYPCTGEWGDWMYGRNNGTLIAFTFETYGTDTIGEYNETTGIYREYGIWDMFNPPANQVMANSLQIYRGLLFLANESPSLSIQYEIKENDNDQLLLKVRLRNPSNFIRTNGSISLNLETSQVTGLTLLNSSTLINFTELGPGSTTEQYTFVFSIDQADYSIHIKLRTQSPSIGDTIVEFDYPAATVATPSFEAWIFVPVIALFVILTVFRKKKNFQNVG